MARRRCDSESGSKSTIDYVFFVEEAPIGVVEIKKSDTRENIAMIQSNHYTNFKWGIRGIVSDLHMKQQISWYDS